MTYEEELACKLWKRHYEKWRANPERKVHELRPKPKGFDLWLQGDNPLRLEVTKGDPGRLIMEEWTSTAKPDPLPSLSYTQPPLPL